MNNPTLIVFVSSKNIQLIDQKGVTVSFAPELFQSFGRESEFGGQNALLLLQRDLIFEYVASHPVSIEEKQLMAQFIAAIPVDPDDLTVKAFKQNDELLIWATKKSFFQQVVRQLAHFNIRVTGVVPLNALTKQDTQSLTLSDVNTIFKSRDLLTQVDFLNQKTQEVKTVDIQKQQSESVQTLPGETKKFKVKPIHWQVMLILAIVALVASLTIGGFYFAQAAKTRVADSKPTPTPTSIPTVIITPTLIAKESLRIKVMNGSGIAGQAGKVANDLNTLGFTSVETANADVTNKNATQVTYGPGVPESVKLEITGYLEKNFSKVVATDDAQLVDWDATILTSPK